MLKELTLLPRFNFIATESRLCHDDHKDDIAMVVRECNEAGFHIHEATAAWAWELYSTTKRISWANPKKKKPGQLFSQIKKFVEVK